MTSYNGAGPQEIESLITKPLEATVGTVSNLKNITSTSSNGSSMIFVEFNDGTDMDVAMLNMREKIDMIKDFYRRMQKILGNGTGSQYDASHGNRG